MNDQRKEDTLQFIDEQFIWRFSPNQTDPALLEAIFVGREPLLQNLVEKIEDSVNKNTTHHVLLHGPRGIGKSHLTTLLHNRVRTNDALDQAVHIAWLNEDETTTSMVQFLVRIYRALCRGYPDDYSLAWLNALHDYPPEQSLEMLISRLAERFKKRKLIVLVENLNLLFEGLGKAGQHTLRALLQEHSFVCMIATTQQLFKGVTDRSEPFHGFFQSIQLQPLTLDDALQLLVNVAETKHQRDLVAFLNTPDGRGRVRAIHDLAGGNHRVYIVLSGFITRESLDQLVAPFQKMADDLTPYYQERLRSISPLQRQVVELLCRERGTLNPKEIARRLFLDQRSIGKQVRELESIGYLLSDKRGRETFYDLSEPLMRLAYEVKEQNLLEMLIDFLRIWYRPEQLRTLQQSVQTSSSKAYAQAALQRSLTQSDPRIRLLENEIQKAEDRGLIDQLPALWAEKASASSAASDWFDAGYGFHKINSFEEALVCYDNALQINPEHVLAWCFKGNSLGKLHRHKEALDCTGNALQIDPEDTYAWLINGNLLNDSNRHEDALVCYDKVLQIEPEYDFAWVKKGNLLNDLDQFEDALACYDKALQIEPEYDYSWVKKGDSLCDLNRHEEAHACYDKALQIDSKRPYTWNRKGHLLSNLDRHQEALACYDKALQIDSEYVYAWSGKGRMLINLDRHEDALACFNKALQIEPEDMLWRFNRVEAYISLGEWDSAIEDMKTAFNDAIEHADYFGNTKSLWSLLFKHSDKESLETRVNSLVTIYQEAAETLQSRKPDQHRKSLIDPVAQLADGLVKSLGKLTSEKLPTDKLETICRAVSLRVKKLSDFDVASRLFRYGMQYLISGDDRDFVELIQAERGLLRQALKLDDQGTR